MDVIEEPVEDIPLDEYDVEGYMGEGSDSLEDQMMVCSTPFYIQIKGIHEQTQTSQIEEFMKDKGVGGIPFERNGDLVLIKVTDRMMGTKLLVLENKTFKGLKLGVTAISKEDYGQIGKKEKTKDY